MPFFFSKNDIIKLLFYLNPQCNQFWGLKILTQRTAFGSRVPQCKASHRAKVATFANTFWFTGVYASLQRLFRLFQFAVTLPVSSAGCKLSFSMIKLYLRDSVADSRLDSLGTRMEIKTWIWKNCLKICTKHKNKNCCLTFVVTVIVKLLQRVVSINFTFSHVFLLHMSHVSIIVYCFLFFFNFCNQSFFNVGLEGILKSILHSSLIFCFLYDFKKKQ